jgi:hypothetical protein
MIILWAGRPGFDSQQGHLFFFALHSDRFHRLISNGYRGPTFGARWPGHEVDNTVQYSTEVKIRGAIPPLPYTFPLLDVSLCRGQITFIYFYMIHCFRKFSYISVFM